VNWDAGMYCCQRIKESGDGRLEEDPLPLEKRCIWIKQDVAREPFEIAQKVQVVVRMKVVSVFHHWVQEEWPSTFIKRNTLQKDDW
jgi:hypothetical protein